MELWTRQVALGPVARALRPLVYHVARIWRRLLFRTVFIAVTGSFGKTTAKELLADILSCRGRTFRSLANQNLGVMVALNVLRVRPWHRFAVIEIGIAEPGDMLRPARLVRPDVAVVLNVFRIHTRGFDNIESYAAEKQTLVASLAPGGLAVLNGDDPRVAAMPAAPSRRVSTFGASPASDFRVEDVSGEWPQRLRFRVHHGAESCEIATQLVGAHWAPSVAAAVACACELGVPLSASAAEASRTVPYSARLEPVTLPNGAVMLRDDSDGSFPAFEASLRVLREADAQRQVLLISDFSEAGLNRRRRLGLLAERLAGWRGLLVVTGEDHDYACRRAIEAGMHPENVHGFAAIRDAAAFLRRESRPGDLVLLKGRGRDHLARIFFAQFGSVACWRPSCKKPMLCDVCWELGFRPDPGQVSVPRESLHPRRPQSRHTV